MPQLQVWAVPRRHAARVAFQAKIGILVMAEDIFLTKAAELLEPLAIRGDERASHSRDRPSDCDRTRPSGRTLAVMLNPGKLRARNPTSRIARDELVKF